MAPTSSTRTGRRSPPGSLARNDERLGWSAADEPAAGADEVDDDVLAQLLGGGEERTAVVDAGHVLDEAREVRAALQHERVDRDALARAALHFLQRLLKRARHRRIREVGDAVLQVGGGLAVGHHEDLLVATLVPGQQ